MKLHSIAKRFYGNQTSKTNVIEILLLQGVLEYHMELYFHTLCLLKGLFIHD